MAKILGKKHKPKVLGADTHSVSLSFDNYVEKNGKKFPDF